MDLREKHIIKVNFHKKWCCKDDIIFFLCITNILPESLELMHILRSLVFLNY